MTVNTPRTPAAAASSATPIPSVQDFTGAERTATQRPSLLKRDIWSGRFTKARRIAYWLVTGYVALSMLFGGVAELLDASLHLEFSSIGIATVVKILGYPLYFVYIIGVCKILGALAILVPGLPRLKEWAYAGLTVNMTGAAFSWLVVTVIEGVPLPAQYGTPMFHVINALHLLALVIVSWALRPASRVVTAK